MTLTKTDPSVRMSDAYRMQRRVLRRPQHPFSLVFKPYQIQPFMLAPVLPGETMKNLLVQARFITDPLAGDMRLIGWWCELFIFYCKHRDLDPTVRQLLVDMMLVPGTNVDAIRTPAGSTWSHCFPNGIDWAAMCLLPIVQEYFRDEGESWTAGVLDGIPVAKIYGKGRNDWSQSITLDSVKRTDRDVLIPANTSVRELIDKQLHWEAIRDAGLTQMDYEDFIATYGAETRTDEASPNLHRPELVRYIRDFQYATNIVEPSTGVPTTAVAWSVAERADKARAFNEPGFLVGCVCVRPKMYMGSQAGSVSGALDNVQAWLPAVTHHNYEAGFKQYAAGTGPVPTSTASYWIDVRDLFLYGEQFVNFTGLAGKGFGAALPTAALTNKSYVNTADVDALFKSPTVNRITGDGIVHLGIAGRQVDRTYSTGM